MALLGNLPIVNFVNCLLCAWVWLSGILAVYLYRRFATANPSLSTGQGAILGALAGVIGAVIGAVISAVFTSAGMVKFLEALSFQLSYRPILEPYVSMLKSGGFAIISLIIDLILYAIFGAIGGLIATAAIWKTPKVI
jgi:hypothetical protein